MQNPERFVMALMALAKTFGVEFDKERAACYELALSDLSIEAIEHAAKQAMRECEFFPAPARLRALAFPVINREREKRERIERGDYGFICEGHLYDKQEWLPQCTPRCRRHGLPVANLKPTVSRDGQVVLVQRTDVPRLEQGHEAEAAAPNLLTRHS